MKVIITAGGTRERIDNVRTLSNTSSGRLGQLIAEAFLGRGVEVIYIHGPHALIPRGVTHLVSIETVSDLEQTMIHCLNDPEVIGVVHAMAVSDYSILSVTDFSVLAQQLETKDHETIVETLHGFDAYGFDRSGKISSNEDGLAVLLKPAPKVLPLIKKVRNDIVLVGFKLLVDVSETELIDVARKLLVKTDCDYILANDLMDIKDDTHRGYLIDALGGVEHYETKQEIAHAIVTCVLRKKA